MRQISENTKQDYNEATEVEGKDRKYYIEKESILEKYTRRATEISTLSYAQFVQRYEPCSSAPENYDIMQDLYTENTQDTKNMSTNPQHISNEIIHEYPISTKQTLPKYIPLYASTSGQHKWLKLRATRTY